MKSVSVVCMAHQSGRDLLKSLPSNQFAIGSRQMLNQNNEPPVLYLVEKIRSEAYERLASR